MNSRPSAGIPSRHPHHIVNDGGQRPPQISRLNSQTGAVPTQPQDAVIDLTTSEGDKSWCGAEQKTEWKAGTPRNETRELDGAAGGYQADSSGGNQDLKPPALPQGAKVLMSGFIPDQGSGSRASPLLAFPLRPGILRPPESGGATSYHTLRVPTAQTATLEPPGYATVLPGDKFWYNAADCDKMRRGEGKVADFFSWRGCHSEDALTEQVVKSGFTDKAQNLQHETFKARPFLWNHLKKNQGLQTLSSLLVTVLEKRQHVGHITTGSTFKPPPRITMTDTRRETWLRDLANPDVPVRRQSKHVPHGIKGKALLEQCLNKNIPIPRAVWLVKCIGANEIRGLKRRGVSGAFAMGGELKWVREWTVFVQQFVESLIGLCGQQDWQVKMQYGTRLATQIFEERLLDREQYLEWLLTCLENAKYLQLPIWLLLVQIYWKHLVSNRQRGKRLAEALLNHLNSVYGEDADTIYGSLISRLRLLLATLSVYHRGCLILPMTWEKYKHLLQASSEQSLEDRLVSAYANIQHRNERLTCHPTRSTTMLSNPTRALVNRLDSFDLNTRFGELSAQCFELFDDKRNLVARILSWASSKHRVGDYRIYLAVRLLRKWQMTCVDINDAVLSFLRSFAISNTLSSTNIFRILAELVRSGHFSMGRYLQWLISEGCLAEEDEIKSFHVRLLAELPVQRLPKHITNLRQSLLQQAHHDLASELRGTEVTSSVLTQYVPNLFPQTSKGCVSISTKELSVSTKLELSRQLRQNIQQHTRPDDLAKLKAKADHPEALEEISAISNEDFCASRNLLEDCNDLAVLADILDLSISSNDESVLASVTDTLHYHARTFAAIGAFKPLSNIIIDRYCDLRARRPTSRAFLLTLRDLMSIVYIDPRVPTLIERDLARCDQKTAVAVCSPISDTNEVMQPSKLDANDEIERIFSSGTTMDEPTMSRLFQKITARMEQHVEAKARGTEAATFSCWLYWLRTFDEKKFESLICDWLIRLLGEGHSDHLHQALCSLAGSGCLSLGSLLDSTNFLQNRMDAQSHNNVPECGTDDKFLLALNMLIPSEVPFSAHLHAPVSNLNSLQLSCLRLVWDAYRLQVCQQMYCKNHDEKVLSLVCQALKSKNTAASKVLHNGALTFVAQRLAGDSGAVLAAFEDRSGTVSTASELKVLADRMVEFGGTMGFSQLPLDDQVTTLVEIADDLSLPFCILALRRLSRLFELDAASFLSSNAMGNDVFSDALEAAVGAGSLTWPDLLQVMPLEITQKVREHAEDTILSLSKLDPENDSNTEESGQALERYLSLIEATSQVPASSGRAYFADIIIERLRTFTEAAARPEDHLNDISGSAASFVHSMPLRRPWLEAIIYLVNINKALFFDGPGSADAQKRIIDVLCTLMREPQLQTCPDLVEYILDLTTSFSDHISPDVRSHLSDVHAASSSSDPRFSFLFGSSVPPDAWLALAHPPTTQPPPPPTTPGSMGPPPQQGTPRLQQSHSVGAKTQDLKTTPFVLNRWELLQAPPPMGENDTSLSLSLFGARQK